MGIRYGKFCGVGWTGCPGEKPCDDLDACCKIHDECVEKKGNFNALVLVIGPIYTFEISPVQIRIEFSWNIDQFVDFFREI